MTTTRNPSYSASPTWISRGGWMCRFSHGKRSSLPFPLAVSGSKFVPTTWRSQSRTPHTRYPLATPRRIAPFDNAEIRCPIISWSALFSLYSTISDSGPRDRIRRTSRPQSRSTELRIVIVKVYSERPGAVAGRRPVPEESRAHRRDLRNAGLASPAAVTALGPLTTARPVLVRLLATAPAPVTGGTGRGLLAGSGQGGLRSGGRPRPGRFLSSLPGGALGVGARGRRRARRPGCRCRRTSSGSVDEGPAVSQEEVVELDVAGLDPEDVPHRPHGAALVIRLGSTTTFVELKNTDPEAAVEEESELG